MSPLRVTSWFSSRAATTPTCLYVQGRIGTEATTEAVVLITRTRTSVAVTATNVLRLRSATSSTAAIPRMAAGKVHGPATRSPRTEGRDLLMAGRDAAHSTTAVSRLSKSTTVGGC